MNTDSRASHLGGADHSMSMRGTTGAHGMGDLSPDQQLNSTTGNQGTWLDSWFVRMVTYCKTGRLLVISTAHARWMLRELQRRGFTQQQASRAEIWISRGDWGLKGAKHTLGIQDFWPTDRQLQSCQCELFPTSALKAAYEQGRSFEREELTRKASHVVPQTPSDELKEQRALHRENLLEILRLKRALAEAMETISRMQSEHDRLIKKIDRLKSAPEEIVSAVG